MHRESRGSPFAFAVLYSSSSGVRRLPRPRPERTSFSWIDGLRRSRPRRPSSTRSASSRRDRRRRGRSWCSCPGTSASAAYFRPLAQLIVEPDARLAGVVRRAPREPARGPLDARRASSAARPRRRSSSTTTSASSPIRASPTTSPCSPDADVAVRARLGHARRGRGPATGDRRGAPSTDAEVVLGGHSLGGSITTAYATWDFNGRAGGEGPLRPRVHRRRQRARRRLTAEEATQRLQDLSTSSPWLTFGGIPSPFAGLFNIVGSTFAKLAPNERRASGDVALAAGKPAPAGAGDERGRIRLRARHRDVAADPRGRTGARRPPRREGDPRAVGSRR